MFPVTCYHTHSLSIEKSVPLLSVELYQHQWCS